MKKEISYETYKKERVVKRRRFLVIVLIILIIAGGIYAYLGFTSDKETLRDAGINSLESEDYEAARDYFNKALDEDQWLSDEIDQDIRYYLAQTYMNIGDYEEAVSTYDIILGNEDNENIQFLRDLANSMISFEAGDYEASLPKICEAVDKGYSELTIYAGSGYGQMGDLENMKKYFDMYLVDHSPNTYLYSQYAVIYMKQNDYETAKIYIDKGYELVDKTYIQDIMYEDIIYYENVNDYDKAFEIAKTYVETYPEDELGKKEYDFLYTRVN